VVVIFVNGLNKKFGTGPQAVPVLRDVSFDVAPGSVFTLLGPSGCGKTTTLRCIAGLESPDTGEIRLGKRVVYSSSAGIHIPVEKRQLGMVFQSYAIWPHMTVGQNVAYPLEGRGLGQTEIDKRVRRALDQVGLTSFFDRPAPNLSGGQQQRVALARALVAEPEVLLLDEPLSNLDAKLRQQMRGEITQLQRRLGLTTLFVTHDQEEALALSDTIALMDQGNVVEVGTPIDLYDFPKDRFTAQFLGIANLIPGSLVGRASGTIVLDTAFGRFQAVSRSDADAPSELFFRPHQVKIREAATQDELNIGRGKVVDATFLGETNDVLVSRGDQTIRLRIHAANRVKPGDDICFEIDSRFALAFKGMG
jgi:iron(III) transport system ATP-binding protein